MFEITGKNVASELRINQGAKNSSWKIDKWCVIWSTTGYFSKKFKTNSQWTSRIHFSSGAFTICYWTCDSRVSTTFTPCCSTCGWRVSTFTMYSTAEHVDQESVLHTYFSAFK
jgi:hypothetical protein